jgi:diacylglycerol kinase (ATP)
MNKKYFMVINPISGAGSQTKESLGEIVKERFQLSDLHVYETTGNGDEVEIKNQLDKLKPDVLLVSGGDGTIKTVAEAVMEYNIILGILPAGSANGLARCLGISNLDDALLAIDNAKVVSSDVLEVNGELCLHMCDFGFNAGLIKKFEQEEERGMLTYFKSSLSQLKDAKPYHFQIETENKNFEVEAQMVIVANGDRYGTGVIINPTGKMDDGKMEIIILNPQGLDEIMGVSLNLIRGNLNENDKVIIVDAAKVKISNPDGADFQIDGEVKDTPREVEIKCIPGKFRFFRLD